MALMSEERRKEMEEEMSRFELEIAGPGDTKASSISSKNSKPLSPPPGPPSVSVLIPDDEKQVSGEDESLILIKAPPPPPPPLSPPSSVPNVLRPPPPPPSFQGPPPAAPQSLPSMRFIPHQLQRQPPKPPVRPSFMPMTGPPGPYPPSGPFGPPQHQVPPMASMPPVGPMPPMGHMTMGPMPPIGPPMHPTGPPMHPMSHGVMPMPMPHQIGNMGMGLPMPPGFCPPSAIPMAMPGEANEQQYFNANNVPQGEDIDVPTSDPPSTSESSSILEASPAIYAAPFVKTHSENATSSSSSTNGQNTTTVTTTVTNFQKTNKTYSSKSEESTVGPSVPTSTASEETVVSKKKEKKKKIVRMAGGQAWEDNSLLDWETDDFRIFCGDLGNDVTDEVLIRAFSKYPSFGKAKVIRDKRTNKTKGYGFVSFKDPQDFIKAMREMNGRYVGSRPIKLRKSTWRDRNIDLVKKKQKEKEKLGLL